MKNVVLVGTYPVTIPRHGGQVRVDAIKQVYVSHGMNVAHLAVYQSEHYSNEPESPWNVTFNDSFVERLNQNNGRVDINASDYLLGDQGAYKQTIDLLLSFSPDIIQLEQCWMWPFLKKARAEFPKLKVAKLIYSSQNIEHMLLEHAVMEGGIPIPQKIVEAVGRMEVDLTREADLVLACSAQDCEYLGKIARKTILALNGIWPSVTPAGLDFWQNEFRNRKFALFVGSAHPPNAAGLLEMLAPNMGFMAPTERLVVVGGVCSLLANSRSFKKNCGLNLARTQLLGVQDSGGLSTLLSLAKVVLVPILAGGGTNIKMAEALYNRKTVVCTTKATRGYEYFLDTPSVIVADNAKDYREAVTKVLRTREEISSVSRERSERLRGLLWSNTLLRMAEAAKGLA